ncbi:MAG: hypothetical protein U0930_05780 [Pirellulales bacterium]
MEAAWIAKHEYPVPTQLEAGARGNGERRPTFIGRNNLKKTKI